MSELSNRRDSCLTGLSPHDHAALRAEVRRCYAEGLVIVHDGWLVSQREYDLLIGAKAADASGRGTGAGQASHKAG